MRVNQLLLLLVMTPGGLVSPEVAKPPNPHFEHLFATLHLSGNVEKAKESPAGQGMPITYNPKRYPGALL